MSTALLFSGQGAQVVGMGKSLYEGSASAKDHNDAHADAIERGLYLANVSQLAPLPLAQLAASLHALAIQEFFKAATSPHPLANTVLTITSTLDVSSRSFKPHPRCGCTWNQKSAPNQGTGL